MIMDYFKNLLIGLVTGIAAYLNPISGEIKSLIAVFALNFICGLLTALLINHESFSFKKAWRCIVEATIFFALVSCIYFIGEHKGNPEGALQCVSFITIFERKTSALFTPSIIKGGTICRISPINSERPFSKVRIGNPSTTVSCRNHRWACASIIV